ncbi:MAG: EcsC family protein, partial [Bacteroidetes bacterium]
MITNECWIVNFTRSANKGIMDMYRQQAISDLKAWKKQMLRRPSFFNKLSKRAQDKINSWIPEKVHNAVTNVIKQMIRGVLFGAKYTTADPLQNLELRARELLVGEKIKFYRTTAAVEGGITGAGGILLGLA